MAEPYQLAYPALRIDDLLGQVENLGPATTTQPGLMSAEDKTKLNDIKEPTWQDEIGKKTVANRTHWKVSGNLVVITLGNISIPIAGQDVNSNVFEIFRTVAPDFVELYDSLVALHGIGAQPFLEITFAESASGDDITQFIHFEGWGNTYEVLTNSDTDSHEITGLEFHVKSAYVYSDGTDTYICLPEKYIPESFATKSYVSSAIANAFAAKVYIFHDGEVLTDAIADQMIRILNTGGTVYISQYNRLSKVISYDWDIKSFTYYDGTRFETISVVE